MIEIRIVAEKLAEKIEYSLKNYNTNLEEEIYSILLNDKELFENLSEIHRIQSKEDKDRIEYLENTIEELHIDYHELREEFDKLYAEYDKIKSKQINFI